MDGIKKGDGLGNVPHLMLEGDIEESPDGVKGDEDVAESTIKSNHFQELAGYLSHHTVISRCTCCKWSWTSRLLHSSCTVYC